MIVPATYAIPSRLETTVDRADLSLSPEVRRPVRFVGRIASDLLSIRFALRALAGVVWSDLTWVDDATFAARTLDPIVTVHPDRVTFEAFSQDLSSSGTVIVPRSAFETEGEVVCGTTNVDFTAWLASAVDELRTSRRTWLRIEPGSVAVQTEGQKGRVERKVDVPDPWVRAFLSLQAAMALPGTRLSLRPVDVIAAIRYLAVTKARISPRGLRFVFEPDQDARLVLEPWEHEIRLKGASHGYTEPRVVRVWGRNRLRLLEPILPYATGARVYLKGRAQPHAWVVDLPGCTFVLGLTGWTAKSFADSGQRLRLGDAVDPAMQARALATIREHTALDMAAFAAALGADRATAARCAARLCRQGRVSWDLERQQVRHREMFADPIDDDALFPRDPREDEADALASAVTVHSADVREKRVRRRLPTPDGPVEREIVHRDLVVAATVGAHTVEATISQEDRLLFGTCTCAFFQEHLLNDGPCAHLLAAWRAANEEHDDEDDDEDRW